MRSNTHNQLFFSLLVPCVLPGVDVEVVCGSRVFKVMDRRSKNHGKDLQLT